MGILVPHRALPPVMHACSFADIENDFDATVARIAVAQHVDPICSRSDWIVPLASAFSASATPAVFTGDPGHVAMLEHDTRNGPVFTSFDSVWGFATPLIGDDPVALASGFAALLPKLDYYALSVSGIDPRGPMFDALRELGPVGYTKRADRCVADLSTGFDDWLMRRSSRFRRSLRTAVRKADERGLTVERIPPNEVDAALARILAIEQQSWKTGERSGLVDTDLGWFTQAMARRFAAAGRLWVLIAQLDGADVGYVIGARVADRYRGFQHSFVDDRRDLSIGKLLQYRNIEQLAAAGVASYDMGMHMAYKMSYSDRVESTVTLVFSPH